MKGRLNKPVLFMLQGTDVEQATPSGNLRRLYSSTSTARVHAVILAGDQLPVLLLGPTTMQTILADLPSNE